MSNHVLIVMPPIDEGYLPGVAVECPGVSDSCRAYIECMVCRDVSDEVLDQLDNEEPVHGIVHTRVPSLGWSRPTELCWLTIYPYLGEAVVEEDLGPGRYLFDWRVVDGEFLELVKVVPA